MATRVVAGGDLLSVDELERELAALISHVQRQKEERVSSNFQQLHDLLSTREHTLLQEMDGIVVRARQGVSRQERGPQGTGHSKRRARERSDQEHTERRAR